MSYADDITITSTHTSTSAAKKYIQQFLSFAWTKHNNLTLSPGKTTCTLFTPDSVEYKRKLEIKINNCTLSMATYPKFLGLALDPELIYSTHIHNISVHAHTPLQKKHSPQQHVPMSNVCNCKKNCAWFVLFNMTFNKTKFIYQTLCYLSTIILFNDMII